MSAIQHSKMTETYHCYYITLPTTAADLADMYEEAAEDYEAYHGHPPYMRGEIEVVIEEHRIIFRWKGSTAEVGS